MKTVLDYGGKPAGLTTHRKKKKKKKKKKKTAFHPSATQKDGVL
jgi:hypothetical protein